MAITMGMVDLIKQTAADAVCPSGSTIKAALIAPGASGSYGPSYPSPYVLGLGGDEVATANGYTQGGEALTGRTVGPSGGKGWVDYQNVVWTAIGSLSAIGAVIYDATESNRIVGFVDFGGTKTASDADFTLQIPGDVGNGLVRIA